MSVTGEFHRLVADCVRCLEAGPTDPADARRWGGALEAAAARSDDSLSEAADAALVLLEDPTAQPAFEDGEAQRRFAEHTDHLAAICRVIVGRPAHPTAPEGGAT